MNKSIILLSTLFAAGAASANSDGRIGARAFQPAQPGLEEAGCGSKTEAKGEKQGSCGAGSCGGNKAKEGEAGKKQEAGKAAAKGKAKHAKGDKQASCGAGSCGADKPKDVKAKAAKENKDGKGEMQASCGAKKDPKG
jgi:hypothetical protein